MLTGYLPYRELLLRKDKVPDPQRMECRITLNYSAICVCSRHPQRFLRYTCALWLRRTVFGAIFTDFLAQKPGNHSVNLV